MSGGERGLEESRFLGETRYRGGDGAGFEEQRFGESECPGAVMILEIFEV